MFSGTQVTQGCEEIFDNVTSTILSGRKHAVSLQWMYSFKEYASLLLDWHTKYTQGFQDISSTENSLLVVFSSYDVQQSAMTYNFSFVIYMIQCDTHTLYLSQTHKLNDLVQSLFVLHTYIHTYVNKHCQWWNRINKHLKQCCDPLKCQTFINNLICFDNHSKCVKKHNKWATPLSSPAMLAINKYMYAIKIGVLKHFYWH
jgi:hypothetical protein